MKCTVQKCCCCFPLKAGTIAIGALYGVFSVANVAYLIERLAVQEVDPKDKEFVLAQACMHGTLIGLFVLLCVLLIYGAVKEKLLLLKIWLLFTLSSLVFWTITYIVLSIVYYATAPLLYAVVYSVLGVLGSVINAYAVLIVYSFYIQLYRSKKTAAAEAAEMEPMSHRRPLPILPVLEDEQPVADRTTVNYY